MRLPETVRADIDGLGYLPVTVAHGQVVPLQELVLGENIGYNQVNRENGKRRLVVTANVRVETLVVLWMTYVMPLVMNWIFPRATGWNMAVLSEAAVRVTKTDDCCASNFADDRWFAGTGTEFCARRTGHFTGVPLALTGGVLALTVRDIPFSISAAVGLLPSRVSPF